MSTKKRARRLGKKGRLVDKNPVWFGDGINCPAGCVRAPDAETAVRMLGRKPAAHRVVEPEPRVNELDPPVTCAEYEPPMTSPDAGSDARGAPAREAVTMNRGIQRCHYCGRRMNETPRSFDENPYCNMCHDERVEKARLGAELEDGSWVGEEVEKAKPRDVAYEPADIIRSRLQTILDKPLSAEMLDQLSHSAHAAREFLFVSGDQDEASASGTEFLDAEFHAPGLPGLPGLKVDSLDQIRDAFVELLRVLGKEEAFEEIVKGIVENFKIVMGPKE